MQHKLSILATNYINTTINYSKFGIIASENSPIIYQIMYKLFSTVNVNSVATGVRGCCSHGAGMKKEQCSQNSPSKVTKTSAEKLPPRLPPVLIRSSCMANAILGSRCDVNLQGEDSLPCRIKCKYPPFSENFNGMPRGSKETSWWLAPPS